MIIDNAGTYTLRYTATDDCGKTTTVDRELGVEEPPAHIYGVLWDGSESVILTRTDESPSGGVTPAVNNGSGSSPFDDLMPWSGMVKVEDAEVGTLVAIPKYWYKWTRTGASMKLQIADRYVEGFSVSPAHMDRGDGVGERSVVYVGRYHCSDADYKSTTGVIPKTNISRSTARTNIHNLGSDIWQYDFAMYWTIAMLYLVEFANWDSQTNVGYGCGNGSSKEVVGATDAMQYHTGTNATSRSTAGQIQYRNIEGVWSNVYDWCDGIYYTNSEVFCIKNPSDFSDNSNGSLMGNYPNTSYGYIREFAEPPTGYEYAHYASLHTSSTNKYICDNDDIGGSVLAVGGSYKNSLKFGMFCTNHSYSNTAQNTEVGCRLMKLPNA